MAISTDDLAKAIEAALVATSGVPGLDPVVARKTYSIAVAAAITAFVVGRTTVVTGGSISGGAISGTGIIK